MKTYSLDLREKILRACDQRFGPQRAMATMFGVSQSADYQALIAPLDVQRFTCIVASGVNLAMTRLYGRAPMGTRVIDSVPHHDGPNLTIVGAFCTVLKPS
jgi:hypothetical protein